MFCSSNEVAPRRVEDVEKRVSSLLEERAEVQGELGKIDEQIKQIHDSIVDEVDGDFDAEKIQQYRDQIDKLNKDKAHIQDDLDVSIKTSRKTAMASILIVILSENLRNLERMERLIVRLS